MGAQGGWVLVRGYQRVDGVLRVSRLGGESGVECGRLEGLERPTLELLIENPELQTRSIATVCIRSIESTKVL